jgi:CarboxypepD_reg-like domain
MPAPSFRSVVLALSALFAVGGWCARPAAAQDAAPDRIAVIGTVVDANTGRAIPGAVVRVADTDIATMTDDGGNFVLNALEPGHLTLTFEQLGYTTIHLSQEFSAAGAPLQVELEPQPVVLEGLKVMADRFQQRRLSTGVSVRVLDTEDFRSLAVDAFDALRMRGGMAMHSCTPRHSTTTWCVLSRGAIRPPTVVIDDRPSMGLEELQLYRTDELYAIEIYRMGQHIRVYTRDYVSHSAIRPRALLPIGF